MKHKLNKRNKQMKENGTVINIQEREKHKKVVRAIRKQTKLSRQQLESDGCYICNCEKTQEHHILRVFEMSQIVEDLDNSVIEELYIPTTDLCDSHHKKLHRLMGDDTYFKNCFNLSDSELGKYEEILDSVDLQSFVEKNNFKDREWVEQWDSAWNKVKSTTKENINKIRDAHALDVAL